MNYDFANRDCEPPDVRTRATVPSHRREPDPSNRESILTSFGGEPDVSIVEVETAALRRAQQRRAGRFLKGPIPLRDIAVASQLPGHALAVFLAVHHRVALTRSAAVKLPSNLMRDLGVSKDAKARALRHLEAVDLIKVQRQCGRTPVIELKSTSND